MQLRCCFRQWQRLDTGMAVMTHQVLDSGPQHLVHLFVPVEWVAQVDDAVEQHHVGTCIQAALTHHQMLFRQFADQLTGVVDDGETTDMVLTEQRHGLPELRVRPDTENRAAHHVADRLLEHHGSQAIACILILTNRWRTWADRLTLFRVAAGLPLLLCLLLQQESMAWCLLVAGGASDAFDGWMARKAGGGSSWGARLDPLADKVLLTAPLLWLAASGGLPLWSVWLLLAREMLISGWRRDASDGAPASRLGKAKTVLQFVSLLLLLWPGSWGDSATVGGLHQIGWWLFWPSLALALHSAVGYLRSNR